MKKLTSVGIVLLAIALGACATPTPETIVVTATPSSTDPLPAEMVAVEWQLRSVLETDPAAQSVIPEPDRYTIQFDSQGFAAIQADCNQVGASYTTSGSSIGITLGPTTLAFCGEDSGDQLYMDALSAVTAYAYGPNWMQLIVGDTPTLSYIRADDVIDLPENPGGVGITADVNLRVRVGPGDQFRIAHWAAVGDQGEAVGQSPDDLYWVVAFPPDHPYYEVGYVLKSQTTISNPSNLEIPVTTPPILNPTVFVDPPQGSEPAGTINQPAVIRTGPGEDYQVWGLSSIGPDVVVTGKAGDYWRIELPTSYTEAGEGWVHSVYVTARNVGNVSEVDDVDEPDLTARPTASGGSQATLRIADEEGAVRTGPAPEYDKILDVPFGTTMSIIGVSADSTYWVVSLPTQTAVIGYGWINMASNTCSKCDVPSDYTPVYPTP